MQSHLPSFSGCIRGMGIFTHHITLCPTLIMVKSFKMYCKSPNFGNISHKLNMNVVGIPTGLSVLIKLVGSAASGGAEP
jgi:hypothetical protein